MSDLPVQDDAMTLIGTLRAHSSIDENEYWMLRDAIRRPDPAPVGVRETAPGVWVRDDGKRPTFSPTYRYEEDPDMRFHDDWGWQHKDVLTEILELANPQPGAVVDKLCTHEYSTAKYDHAVCDQCGSVHVDSGWGIAANRWFTSLDQARFYRKNGYLPTLTNTDKGSAG